MSEDFLPVHAWGLSLPQPLLIAGPCSIETPEQTMETVLQLGGDPRLGLVRGGIWKPRTRPGSFEGVGSIGLPWLKAAGTAIGKPVMTEVAKAIHVEEALAAGMDALWIGARTTTNSFAVQEVADALKGIDIPVFVKNPVNPDVSLWLGAVERLQQAGIRRLAAIHRGFSFYGKTRYRNQPLWEIPLELRRHLPSLPIICDPSHICGNRELLQSVGQRAYDLGFDGLMIESHRNPDTAWSDAAQQVTPAQLRVLLDGLVRRNPEVEDPALRNRLDHLREEIDQIDHKILALFGERMGISRKIGAYKHAQNIAIYQPARWNFIRKDRMAAASGLNLSEEFVQGLLEHIHQESIRHQTEMLGKADER